MSNRLIVAVGSVLVLAATLGQAYAGVVFSNVGLSGGVRWDAAPRMIGTNERSLDGGLRYSLEGGTFEAYRDLFQWSTLPSVPEFQTAVEQAFNAWTAVDPISGLHTDLTFIADFATAVIGTGTFTGFDINGAEIDLLAADSGETRRHAVTGFSSLYLRASISR